MGHNWAINLDGIGIARFKMKGLFCFAVIGLSTTTFPNHANDAINSLVNCKYIREYLTHEAAWADSHAAEDDNLGAGMLYLSLIHI